MDNHNWATDLEISNYIYMLEAACRKLEELGYEFDPTGNSEVDAYSESASYGAWWIARKNRCPTCRGGRYTLKEKPKIPCEFCKGSGEREPHTRMEKRKADSGEKTPCMVCHGNKYKFVSDEYEECSSCKGTGKRLSANKR